MEGIVIQQGWALSKANAVARLYEEAFGSKFTAAIHDKQRRLAVLSKCFVPEFSYVLYLDNEIIGLAGFNTAEGSLTGGMGLAGLIRELGWLRGIWAAMVFSLFERRPKPKELVMDGIAVDAEFRGRGFGSTLLEQITSHASLHGFDSVRLDVIDSNPRARKLYESKGFIATHSESFPYLKFLLGFSGSTTMVLKIA